MEWSDVVELLLELLFELVFPVMEELLGSLAVRHEDRWDRSFPLLPILLWGAASGAVSCLVWPHRVIRGKGWLLGPVLTGRVMRWVGERLRAREVTPTALASFRGGALFGFGMALARFVCVGLR